ncbi:NTP transferase domain-containing protein [Thermoactinomyces mirandus]|uniref:NTP transferase domain-containing protein n=1 Tax=Thermoactinomyces mirandus TaxID=2756294 RepID=A0A7W2ARL3_9BACL|nr:NTP transferase domain-containing protein [Thermoactinomyces mirandus]MBA4603109.1 NTP transferase domain-containing protein [Thermoactinomyces mirandus]
MRAILLAAGMGTRLRPITFTTPKSLIPINGEPLLERQIRFLKEIGVREIVVVTGYLHKKFSYLKEKYHVTLIRNDRFDCYNNVYSMYLVRKYLPGAYVIDADNYLRRNFLLKKPDTSLYFSAKKPFRNEWVIHADRTNKVRNITIDEKGNNYILCGISYWSEADGRKLVRKLEETVANGNFKDLYWDNIVKDNIDDLNVYLKKIDAPDTYEIDCIDDLHRLRQEVL